MGSSGHLLRAVGRPAMPRGTLPACPAARVNPIPAAVMVLEHECRTSDPAPPASETLRDKPRPPSRPEQEVLSLFSGYRGRKSSPERARDQLGPQRTPDAEPGLTGQGFVGAAITCRQKLRASNPRALPLGAVVTRLLFY